jgi:hypothetical protein
MEPEVEYEADGVTIKKAQRRACWPCAQVRGGGGGAWKR